MSEEKESMAGQRELTGGCHTSASRPGAGKGGGVWHAAAAAAAAAYGQCLPERSPVPVVGEAACLCLKKKMLQSRNVTVRGGSCQP